MSSASDPDTTTPRSATYAAPAGGEPSLAQRRAELEEHRANASPEAKHFGRRLNLHESGHAAAAVIEGVRAHLIWATGTRGKTIYDAKSAFAATAGCAAEMLFFDGGHLSDDDRSSALAALGVSPDSADVEARLDEEIRKARERLAPHKAAILALADAVEAAESGQITRTEIQRIWEEASNG